jgi:hypothetical protein
MDGDVMAAERDHKTILEEMRVDFQAAYDAEQDNFREAIIDLKYRAGDQWPEEIARERQDQGRPMITINHLAQFVNQVVNDIRQSDFSIKASPVDSKSDPKLAKIFDGLMRQIQYQSAADHVYSTAADHQVTCGIGWWRVCSEYASDEVFEQEVRLKVIRNPLSVFCDPAAEEPDRSDMMFACVTSVMPVATFKAKYPGKATEGAPQPQGTQSSINWSNKDGVRIVEYWKRKPITKTLYMLQDGTTTEKLVAGQTVKASRKVDTYEVCQYICSGMDVLEEPRIWPSKWIPLVPVIGTEVPLDDKIVRQGMVRMARDAQHLYNYNRTASAEALAAQPKNPWIVPVKNIAKWLGLWENANKGNPAYLPYSPDPENPAHKPYREAPAAISNAFSAEALQAREDLNATTGIYPAALGAKSNETSGVAINRREKQGDTANYHYPDKMRLSLWHTGRILIDVIPKFYDSERIVRLLGEDDTEELVTINQNTVQYMDDGEQRNVTLNDVASARFDIRAKVGKSHSTMREESADSMLEFCRVNPAAMPLVQDLIAKNMDWPGADEMSKRFKNVLEGKPPLFDPDKPETQQPPPQPPPPEVLKIEAQKEQAAAKLEQDAQKNEQTIQLQREKTAADIQLQREKNEAEMAMREREMMMEAMFRRMEMRMDAQLEAFKAHTDARIKEMTASRQMDLREDAAHRDADLKEYQSDRQMNLSERESEHSARLAEKSARAKANGSASNRAT